MIDSGLGWKRMETEKAAQPKKPGDGKYTTGQDATKSVYQIRAWHLVISATHWLYGIDCVGDNGQFSFY